jgi:hypothetical protein
VSRGMYNFPSALQAASAHTHTHYAVTSG